MIKWEKEIFWALECGPPKTATQIFEVTGIIHNIRGALNKLVEKGVLTKTTVGRRVYYSIKKPSS